MNDHVQVRASGSGDWELLTDATVQDSPHGRTVNIPVDSPMGARLTGHGMKKWFVVMSDQHTHNVPNLWRGIIRSWRPQGDRLLLDVRKSTVLEHTYS